MRSSLGRIADAIRSESPDIAARRIGRSASSVRQRRKGARSNVPARIVSMTSSIIERIACWRVAMSSGCVYSVALRKYSPA